MRPATVPEKVIFLSPEQLNKLTKIDNRQSTYSICQTLLILSMALLIGLFFWQPLVLVIVIVIIATQQHALIVLAHEATHYRLFEPRQLNEWIGRTCGTMAGISMCTYRIIHRLHHNYLYQENDPDIPLHGGYPRGRIYLIKKLLRDLCGLTAWKTYGYFFGCLSQNGAMGARNLRSQDTSFSLLTAARIDRYIVAAAHLAGFFISIITGFVLEYLILWILPLATVVPALLRLRALCEHGAVNNLESPVTAARTNISPKWFRFFLFPHHVNYHMEHHVYPSIPHYNLPACHDQMTKLGLPESAEVRSIWKTLSTLFSDHPRVN